MNARDEARRAFVARSLRDPGPLRDLAGDASSRRYFRVADGGRDFVLMDSGADPGQMQNWIAMQDWLARAGASVPEIVAHDQSQGLLISEDFGDGLFYNRLQRDRKEEGLLYDTACDLLGELQRVPPPDLPPYDIGFALSEVEIALDWYVDRCTADERTAVLSAFSRALAAYTGARQLVLRDYHAQNLFWLPERRGTARVGLIDFQDARLGHRAYDVASLVGDARRDVSPAVKARIIARMGSECAAIHAWSAQRNAKILGIFARLARRDGKARYLGLLGRVWTLLQADLDALGDAELTRVVDMVLPPPERSALAGTAVAS